MGGGGEGRGERGRDRSRELPSAPPPPCHHPHPALAPTLPSPNSLAAGLEQHFDGPVADEGGAVDPVPGHLQWSQAGVVRAGRRGEASRHRRPPAAPPCAPRCWGLRLGRGPSGWPGRGWPQPGRCRRSRLRGQGGMGGMWRVGWVAGRKERAWAVARVPHRRGPPPEPSQSCQARRRSGHHCRGDGGRPRRL